jgi:osmotically-inducible protein OsmY
LEQNKGTKMLNQLIDARPEQEIEWDDVLSCRRSWRDDRLLDDAQQRLNSCGIRELCSIECDCQDGKLTLRGRLSSYYLKQKAQEALRSLRDIESIVNETVVAQIEDWDEDY